MTAAADILGKPLCALAFCWRLERRDGIAIGLTSHDRALVIDGFPYSPAPGMTPSAILRAGGGPDADPGETLDIKGALSATAISERDLAMGRWDGAALAIHLTEWTDPGALWLELARGTLGSVEQAGGRYAVGVASPLGLLDRAVAPETSPTCRASLGDRACGVDLRRHVAIVRIVSTADEQVTVSGLADGAYPFGTLRWLDGPACGLAHAIIAQEGDVLTLAEPPAATIAPGTMARLTEGCDKRLDTCAMRFGNALNFRGEPFLPGMDLLTRYVGA